MKGGKKSVIHPVIREIDPKRHVKLHLRFLPSARGIGHDVFEERNDVKGLFPHAHQVATHSIVDGSGGNIVCKMKRKLGAISERH